MARINKKFYTELSCPCCNQRLRVFMKRPLEEIYIHGCSNLACNRKRNKHTNLLERITPYETQSTSPEFINEAFYGDTNPIFGKALGAVDV